MSATKKKTEIYYSASELAKELGVMASAITNMKKKGHLPKGRMFYSKDPKVAKVIAMNKKGFDVTGKPNAYQKTKKNQAKDKVKGKRTVDELKAKAEALISKNKINEITSSDLDTLCEKLKLELNTAPTEGIRRQVAQTLVDIERFKKLEIETSQKKGDVIPREQVRWFFNKYFNSLNESLIELPSVSLSEKLLGEVRMLERRSKPKQVINKYMKDLLVADKEAQEEIVEEMCAELSPKVDEAEIKIKIQGILQTAISQKIKATHEGIKKTRYFKQDGD